MNVRLIPGVNEVHEKFWDEIKTNPGVKKRLDLGFIELVECKKAQPAVDEKGKKSEPVEETKAEGEGASILEELKSADAIAVVKETLDFDKLKEWKGIESRKGVLKAIDDQIELLEVPEKKEEKKEGDE
jgi:hypothetical protein